MKLRSVGRGFGFGGASGWEVASFVALANKRQNIEDRPGFGFIDGGGFSESSDVSAQK